MPSVQTAAFRLFVGGEWASARDVYELVNPARPWELVGSFGAAEPDDVAAAAEAASAALSSWSRRPAIERGEVLYRAAELIEERAEELARDVTLEIGKPIRDARSEVRRAAAIMRYFAGECAQPIGEVYASTSAQFLHTRRVPLGIVAAITPWNVPFAIPAWKLAPAVAFGNAVVWKPAQIASLSAVRLVEVLDEAGLPPGVLNLVTGSAGHIGEALVGLDRLAAVTFTGSNAVGRGLRETLSARNVRLQLELGGKNPGVVLRDADLDLAARELVDGAMGQAGQRCTATSRVIAERAVLEPLLDRLEDRIAALLVGDPLDEATDVGPLASSAQFERVCERIEQGRSLGLELRAGGRWTDAHRGYFVDPTLLVDPDGTTPLSREEIFGPVLCVTPVEDADAALRLANATEYGLSASVFTRSLDQALAFADGLEAGVVHVNGQTTGAEPHVPFGGMKESSSSSREQGKAAAEFFTQVKTIYVH
jgi:acyl-CoA reductase-like NAD-dependent aldehyde dehydrogenase